MLTIFTHTAMQIDYTSVYTFLIIFCRIGAFCLLLPGIGEVNVPARVRLLLSLAIAFPAFYLIEIPLNIPTSSIKLFLCIFEESLIGISLALMSRLVLSAIIGAGTIISMSSGLSIAMVFDPAQGTQSSLFGSFMSMLYITLFMITDSHLFMIKSIIESYQKFPLFSLFSSHDYFAQSLIYTASEAFKISMHLAAPFLLISILTNLAGGILSRLMPQMQTFFVIVPAQILLNFALFAITVGGATLWLLNLHNEKFSMIFGG